MASDAQPALRSVPDETLEAAAELVKRIAIPLTTNSPPGLVQALTLDPWSQSGKYALGWTYFALAVVGLAVFIRVWHFWQDKIRQAIYKQEMEQHFKEMYSLDPDWDRTGALATGMTQAESRRHFFPDEVVEEKKFKPKAHFSSVGFVNDTLALFRWVFYRPIPDIVWRKHRFTFSSVAVLFSVFVALSFVTIFSFLQQPLYWQSIRFGSPPLAIRSGMIAVSMTPWIVATSTKANILSFITGIGPERLNVFHRWLSYLCLFMSLVHTVPFYIQPVWEDGGMDVFSAIFPPDSGIYIYGTGIACLVPLVWLCAASLPIIRRKAYELFVMLHVPVGFVYVGMLFWHTKNYLLSWNYLIATIAIFVFCNVIRLFNLNWARPWRLAFMIGDEAAINIMTENTIKITIPTQMRWKPGQYVYLRMPGISVFENHPFTISSLCSEDFPSEYGEQYRDCVLVFRPYGGFTRKVLETAIEKGPFHTYRAFLDGPYGGMRRELAAFDTCILIAGGSGITSLMSQLLNLIKRMRDGKAITKKIVVVWALKRLEAMDWFREELRICREAAPPETVTCKFFVTAAVRHQGAAGAAQGRAPRPLSNMFHDKLDGFVAGIANKRNSALIMSEAQGDPDKERELRAEDEDRITALPQQKYLQPHSFPPPPPGPPPNKAAATDDTLRRLEGRDSESKQLESDASVGDSKAGKLDGEFHFPPLARPGEKAPHFNFAPPAGRQRYSQLLAPADASGRPSQAGSGGSDGQDQPESGPSTAPVRPPELAHLRTDVGGVQRPRPTSTFGPPSGFEFGFPETPTEFQRSLMRFAFPIPHEIDGGWSVEYGRPDLGYMLKEWATGGPDGRGVLGRRTAVYVCGPPSMRVGVATTVARLQAEIWGDDMLEEIFLHAENYAL
ncbi:ferric reductase like transmembrane component-domain-containing protein [Lasiosphaeria miniovina]|uniref:ferric-chelate reductase (NADPH) n=1 Tax=Lasiosphaeria miniovina TaxID=1954250 RepID=A0AA40EDP8_9PEZI|nr:ferric reductase like transmembrane component-domain-containing protein [Lasiosphaeria miniovina]KAK0733671.1 ferric reductase like transmembrane component-domain-containing protein [Lasiosphaeria miniovina]